MKRKLTVMLFGRRCLTRDGYVVMVVVTAIGLVAIMWCVEVFLRGG